MGEAKSLRATLCLAIIANAAFVIPARLPVVGMTRTLYISLGQSLNLGNGLATVGPCFETNFCREKASEVMVTGAV